MRIRIYLVGFVFTILASANAMAVAFDPFDFNVYSLGDIGRTQQGYGADFQGIAGVGGNAYFSGFSLHDVAAFGPQTPYSLYAGGNVRITGAINNGGVEAGGDLDLRGASIGGAVNAGGDLLGTGGSILGDVTLGGDFFAGPSVSIGGGLSTSANFTPSMDLTLVSDFFLDASDNIAGLQVNTSYVNQWGQLLVNLQSGTNVLEIEESILDAAWGISITGPEDADLFINVLADDAGVASFDSLVWTYAGGASSEHTLMNLLDAQLLRVSGGDHRMNLLAPRTEVEFAHGLITGNLIAGALQGAGQVNAGGFAGRVPIPEPQSLMLLAGIVLLNCSRAARRHRSA